MSKRRDWFKWKLRAGRRGTLRRAALRTGNGFEAMGACVALLDHARGESHWTDNPEGVFRTSVEDLSIDYSTPEHRVRESLGALVATGWLNASSDVASVSADDEVSFRVVRYLAFNDPQGSPADRKAAERDRDLVAGKALAYRSLLSTDINADAFAEVLDLRGNVTVGHNASAMSPEEKREEGEGEQSDNELSPSVPKDDVARRLFDHWLTATNRNPNQNRLTKKRRGLVRARLAEGYTEQQMTEAINGFAASSWHQGQNPNGTRYDTFQFIFRDGENIEKGVERAAGPAPTTSTPVSLSGATRHNVSREYDDGIQWHNNDGTAA